MRVKLLCLLIACSAAGCATRAPAAQPVMVSSGEAQPVDADQQIVWDDHAQIVDFDAQLAELSASGDCGGACEAGAQICALSDRICDIAGRNPGDTDIGDRCTDGRQRCERARERLAQACQCLTSE